MTNVKLEKSTILSIGGTVRSDFPGASHVQLWGGGGIRLIDNGVHETHVAK